MKDKRRRACLHTQFLEHSLRRSCDMWWWQVGMLRVWEAGSLESRSPRWPCSESTAAEGAVIAIGPPPTWFSLFSWGPHCALQPLIFGPFFSVRQPGRLPWSLKLEKWTVSSHTFLLFFWTSLKFYFIILIFNIIPRGPWRMPRTRPPFKCIYPKGLRLPGWTAPNPFRGFRPDYGAFCGQWLGNPWLRDLDPY